MNGSRQRRDQLSIAWRECRRSLNRPQREARERASFASPLPPARSSSTPVIDNFQLALKAGGNAEQLRAGSS